MDNNVKPSADNIAAAAKAASRRGPPPVDQWNPPFCGDLDIRIARDGTWYYLGTPIGRMPLVKLFASILKLEGGKFFLVTPVEKVGIKVDDAPLLAVDFEVTGTGKDQSLRFVTKTEDEVEAGDGHDIRVEKDPETGEPSPYIHIRRGLWALIDRKSFYRLVDLCLHETLDGQSWFGLWSRGRFYPVIASKELN
jgi:uncharacterized protein